MEILDSDLPSGFSSTRPRGGYFIWVTGPPDGFSASEFAKALLEAKRIFVLSGPSCGLGEEARETRRLDRSFRIAVANYEKVVLEQSVRTICQELAKFMMRKN